MKYFAYGTLLSLSNMQKLAASAKIDGYMRLDGFIMGFGVCPNPEYAGCTLLKTDGGNTYGVQFDLSEKDMARLDRAAHVPDKQWARKSITLTNSRGKKVLSQTYHIPGEYTPWRPTDSYVDPILAGLEESPFPQDYKLFLRNLIAEAQNVSGS